MEITQIWKHAQGYILNELKSDVSYNIYLKDAVAVDFTNSVFTIGVSLPTKKNMIEILYKPVIEASISKVIGQPVKLSVIISDKNNHLPVSENINTSNINDVSAFQEKKESSLPINMHNTNLNPRYTFENFVVGNSNSQAFGFAKNVVNFPAQNNNPLFLYGKSGLGKTHLMQAIGNEFLKNNPDKCVLYVTSEQFMNDMVNCLKEKKMEIFRQRYRDVDMLLVDDVQFIEGREGTQEEFFHTFNDLHMKNKQIVLTSDRKPKDLITLEERLRTRFEWGLSVDVVLPNYETRVAILQKKAESMNIHITNEICEYIAERINSNVRELEGALSKIIAYAGISHQEINQELAEFAISSIIANEVKITPDAIIQRVADFYHVSVDEIKGSSRVKELVTPRHIAMYLCKTLTDMNFVTIAKVFSNRDRTSVMHGVDKIMKNINIDSNLKSEIEFITKDLNP